MRTIVAFVATGMLSVMVCAGPARAGEQQPKEPATFDVAVDLPSSNAGLNSLATAMAQMAAVGPGSGNTTGPIPWSQSQLAQADYSAQLAQDDYLERKARLDQPIFLTIKADLSVAVGDNPVSPSALQSVLDGVSKGDRGQRIFVRTDKSVAYGSLMEVMNALRTAGYLKLALVGLEAELPY
jgi:biopolymer transport protein ExbD